MAKDLAIGIDIGGTHTVFGIVDKKGNLLKSGSISTKNQEDLEAYINLLYRQITDLSKDYKGRIAGIGVGAPNGNYYNKNIEFAPNLPWKGVIPLGDLLEEKFKLPVQVTNDANAAAQGEMIYGVAKGLQDFVMITMGTGLGSGIVVNGQIVYGHDGFAGELGHVIVEKGGRNCGCGRKGCLETYVSATGMVKTAKELLKNKSTASVLREIKEEELTAKAITQAAHQCDAIAEESMEITGKILGEALANFTAFTAPSAFVLFGGLAASRHLILEPAQRYMNANLLKIWQNKIDLFLSGLPNGEGALLGAAALVWSKARPIASK